MRFLHGHMHIAFSEYDWDGEGENLQYVLVYPWAAVLLPVLYAHSASTYMRLARH